MKRTEEGDYVKERYQCIEKPSLVNVATTGSPSFTEYLRHSNAILPFFHKTLTHALRCGRSRIEPCRCLKEAFVSSWRSLHIVEIVVGVGIAGPSAVGTISRLVVRCYAQIDGGHCVHDGNREIERGQEPE